MFLILFSKIKKYKIEIYLINLIILLYLYRTAVPLLKYPFLLLSSVFVIYVVIDRRHRILSDVISFLRDYYLVIILAFIFYGSILFSHKLYLAVFKDAISLTVLIFLFIILNTLVTTKKDLPFFVNSLIRLIISFALLVSIFRFFEFFDILSFESFFNVNNNGDLTVDNSKVDYNFALIPIFYGIIAIFSFLLKKNNSVIQKIYFNLFLFIFSIHILFSGSRRGVVALIVLVITLLIMQLFSFIKKNNNFKRIRLVTVNLILTLLLTSFCTYSWFFKTSVKARNSTFEVLGIINVKGKITSKLYKYVSIFDNTTSYIDFYKTMWIPEFDPRDPDSGWGTRVHEKVFALEGAKVEIVPSDAIGYKMDSTCNSSYYSQVNLCESYSLIVSLKINKGERYKASVYCYVPDVFDGNSVGLGLPVKLRGSSIVDGVLSDKYDLTRKGEWQKLEIQIVCHDEGWAPIYINFIKNGVKDFTKLNGYVIFAYPEYNKVELNDSSLSMLKEDKFFNLNKNNYDLLPSSKSELSSSNIPKIYMQAGFLSVPFSYLANVALILNDKDPIRNWAANFISEDTTYYRYKSDLLVDTISSKFTGSRITRWKFAWQIFTKEYTLSQKLFGGGFNFLNWYGDYFLGDKTKSDYPHNPFLHILLYSGVLGLMLYMFFMYKVFYYYIKYIKEYYILFIFFLITFFFTFFSGGSPFDPPMMGFFVILPFFIHSVHKNSITE